MKNRSSILPFKHGKRFCISALVTTLCLCYTNYLLACGNYTTLKANNSRVKSVTVFLDGAQVERQAYFNLKTGSNELVFNNVSPFINSKSIQVKGKGDFTILDVRHHIHHPKPQTTNQEVPDHVKRDIHLLSDSIQAISFDLEEIKTQKDALELEKKILLANGLFNGSSKKSDSIPILKEGMLYLRTKLNDINKQLFALRKNNYYKQVKKNEMQSRLEILKNYQSHQQTPPSSTAPEHQIIVTVSAKEAVRASLNASYLVANAGWTAHYDLRASNTSSPVKLTYKAKVFQQTGEDWKDVNLKLSTNNPNRSNVKPTLPIWFLNYYQRRNISTSNLSNVTESKTNNSSESLVGYQQYRKEMLFEQDANTSASYTQMSQNIVGTEFDIALPYSIKSNGEAHLVEIQTKSLPATYYHTVVPKLDQNAFVMSKITDWEGMNLLPASANIFFDGTYIGETFINPTQLNDTLSISLGRDPSVYVQRKKLKDKIKIQTIGNNRIQEMGFEIILKNRKTTPIHLVVEDHIPVSRNEEIKINAIDLGNAKHNEVTGALSWKLELPQGKEQKLHFSYSIKYDKNKPLLGAL